MPRLTPLRHCWPTTSLLFTLSPVFHLFLRMPSTGYHSAFNNNNISLHCNGPSWKFTHTGFNSTHMWWNRKLFFSRGQPLGLSVHAKVTVVLWAVFGRSGYLAKVIKLITISGSRDNQRSSGRRGI